MSDGDITDHVHPDASALTAGCLACIASVKADQEAAERADWPRYELDVAIFYTTTNEDDVRIEIPVKPGDDIDPGELVRSHRDEIDIAVKRHLGGTPDWWLASNDSHMVRRVRDEPTAIDGQLTITPDATCREEGDD